MMMRKPKRPLRELGFGGASSCRLGNGGAGIERAVQLIDLAAAKPVAVPEHVRPVVVVLAVEEYEPLKVFEIGHVDSRASTSGTAG